MCLDEPTAERQAEAGACLASLHVADLAELLEDAPQILRRDADTRV